MKKQNLLQDAIENAPNRRRFMKTVGMASAVLAGSRSVSAQAAITDADILNFALNLEYLEAEFYTVATTGKTIDQLGIGITGDTSMGAAGATTGGKQVTLSNSLVFTGAVALEIAQDERDHVTYIRTQLMAAGATPVAKPAINLDALGIGFNGEQDFLVLARAFEDTGVTAYAGAAPLISNSTILGKAARILAAEAEHVANIRLQIARFNIATMPLDVKDILPPPSGTEYFSLDSNGLCETRTPQEVLAIVYHASGVTSGGFFPNGVNGYFHGVASVAATGLTPD